MRKSLNVLACLSMVIPIVVVSASPAQAQNKPDQKVMKECEAVNETYDSASYFLYLKAPLSKNRDLARVEISDKQLNMSSVLIDCGKLDMKTWKSMKNDYIAVIKNSNAELRKIVKKYNFLPMVTLTCVRKGKITNIESTNPQCPKGFKELYRK